MVIRIRQFLEIKNAEHGMTFFNVLNDRENSRIVDFMGTILYNEDTNGIVIYNSGDNNTIVRDLPNESILTTSSFLHHIQSMYKEYFGWNTLEITFEGGDIISAKKISNLFSEVY